jgi:tetratricopeptide (TPR) repeat protein
MNLAVDRFLRFVVMGMASLLVAGAAIGQARGQNLPPSQITGVVRSQNDNKSLPHIKIQLTASDGEPVDTHYTNSDGTFSFSMLPQGTYVLTINDEAYIPYREEVEVLGFPGARVNIALRDAVKEKPLVKGDVVSSRELTLPQKAQEALRNGLEMLFQKQNPAASLPFFQAVLDASAGFYEASYYQGVAYLKLGRKGEAETAFHRAIESSQDHFAEADFALASMLADEGRFADAEKIDRNGLQIQPDAWRGHYELASILLGTNRPSEAEQSALEAGKHVKNYPQLFLLLANIHLRLLRNEAAIEDLNAYLKLDPSGAYSDQARALKAKTEQTLGHAPGSPPQHP